MIGRMLDTVDKIELLGQSNVHILNENARYCTYIPYILVNDISIYLKIYTSNQHPIQ